MPSMTISKLTDPTAHQKPRRNALLCVVAFVVFSFFAGWANASETNFPQAHDEFWLVSARDIPDCRTDAECSDLKCFRKINGQWCSTTFNQLSTEHLSDPSKETVLHVHGMRTDFNDAKRQCSTFYQNTFANCNNRPPIRFVCWVWRSETKTPRPVWEFKTKSRRAVLLGRLFTKTLHCFGDRPPILIGYSLGAQLIASAITDPAAAGLPSYRFAAIAPVLDCEFASSFRNPACTQQTVVFASRSDRATRFAAHICRKQGAPTFNQWAGSMNKPLGNVGFVDVTSYVGGKHSIDRYTSAPPVRACIIKMVRDNALLASNHMTVPREPTLIINEAPIMSADPIWSGPELQESVLVAPAE